MAASFSRRIVVLVAIAAAALSACIIGPKQDDPSPSSADADSGAGSAIDSSIAEDLEGGKITDSALPLPSDTMTTPMPDVAAIDTGCAADADGGDACVTDAPADAASDAVTDAADGG